MYVYPPTFSILNIYSGAELNGIVYIQHYVSLVCVATDELTITGTNGHNIR